jgi:hypothetical protein
LSGGAARFAARYPRVWHVIEAEGFGTWVPEMGLLPAAEICRRAGHPDDGANRGTFQRVELGRGQAAVLRLQQMPDHRLSPTLAGVFAGRPDLWRQHVDRHVFFWTEERRRDDFIRACVRLRRAASPAPVMLAVDTGALLQRHVNHAFFATFNIGSTVRGGARARRDENTLRPLCDYRSGPVAELAVRGRVDISGITVCDT